MTHPYAEGKKWRMYCADCMGVLPSLVDGSIHAVVTDPPYGINCTKVGAGERGKGTFHRYTTAGAAKIRGDKEVNAEWLVHCYRLLCANSILYSFSRWDVDREWQTAIESAGFRVKNRIIWVKANGGSGDLEGCFSFQHETIWRATKGRSLIRGKRTGDVWRDAWTECIRHGKNHPFQKPLDLVKRMVLADTDAGMVVLDPFCGTATTGVVCLQTGREFIGIEVEEKWCDFAARRLEVAARNPVKRGFLGVV